MKLRLSVTVISITTCFSGDAQKTIKHADIIWISYANTIRVNSKWSVNPDVQIRTTDWINQWLLYAARTGISYSFNKKLSAGTGMALFRNAVYDKARLLFFKNEWRPWQELAYVDVFKNGVIFSQRMRTEERFQQLTGQDKRTSDYQFIFRLRYRLDFQFTVIKKTGFIAGDEVFVNPGYAGNSFFFDQNRTFAGVSIRTGTGSTLYVQYIKIYQWKSSTSILEDQDVIRVNFIQKFTSGKQGNQ